MRKVTISFAMSSVLPSAWNSSASTGRISMKFDIRGFFENLSKKFKFHKNQIRITCILHEDQYTFSIISRWVFLKMKKKMLKTHVVEKLETRILCSVFFFENLAFFWDNVEKCCRARQATDDNMAHVHCLLDTQGYKYAHRLCNTLFFSTATMVAWTRLSVALYVLCLSCF